MSTIQSNSIVDLFFQLSWRSDQARHTEAYSAGSVNLWRDILPTQVMEQLSDRSTGDVLSLSLEPGQGLKQRDASQVFQMKRSQFNDQEARSNPIVPSQGRFFPKGLLTDVVNVFKGNQEPFRLLRVDNGSLLVDFNHPLAGRKLDLSTTIGAVRSKAHERGGTSQDWLEVLASGPGMQARWKDQPTDFFSGRPFEREDENPDKDFYRMPRMVHHLDSTARDLIASLYARLLSDGMEVLDLMSSWESHLPRALRLKRLSGLGLNASELWQNDRLTDRSVHDLNERPILPYADASFDAVVCTASIEYLIHPMLVMEETARVLRPGGVAAFAFSNRWFAPKAIRIWSELHEYERMGLVLEYLLRSRRFDQLETYAIRGLPRPHDDRYFPGIPTADPVYLVWGRRMREPQ